MSDLLEAIVRTIAYADVFDYPLSAVEIHRYLIEVPASQHEVAELLSSPVHLGKRWVQVADWYTLPGREEIVHIRRRRQEIARRMWPRAVVYGGLIGALPYVRMVALTGALAVDNVEPEADIDYLIVTQPGRLWLCRAMTILVVRWAARRGDVVCPNYLISERALTFPHRSLYTAHELVQMVPLAGLDVYRRMLQANVWVRDFLPNASLPMRTAPAPLPRWRWISRAAELGLSTPIGSALERWEMERKIRRLSQENGRSAETAFSADWCKGHFADHGQRSLRAFEERIRHLEGLP
ncbi:MAG: hypothetical protein Kow0047_21680 [Anaerolineae bacterium]